MFCAVTGYAGTPDIRAIAAPGATGRTVTVRFNADTSPSLPWQFTPGTAYKRVTLGEDNLAWYEGRNLAQVPVTGMATYNVTPEKAGKYFHKTACFCFNEQTLAPGQDMRFPLSYWVDPAIATDPDTPVTFRRSRCPTPSSARWTTRPATVGWTVPGRMSGHIPALAPS